MQQCKQHYEERLLSGEKAPQRQVSESLENFAPVEPLQARECRLCNVSNDQARVWLQRSTSSNECLTSISLSMRQYAYSSRA